MNEQNKKCWICRAAKATSGEHITKASDMKADIRHFDQKNPAYFHSDVAFDIPVKSIDNDRVKMKVICEACNTTLSQPFDRAWERLSDCLRSGGSERRFISKKEIYGTNSYSPLVEVHLYFLKILGCRLADLEADFNLKPFSRCLRRRESHPDVYIAFGKLEEDWIIETSCSQLIFDRPKNPSYMSMILTTGRTVMDILYWPDGTKLTRQQKFWHPRQRPGGIMVCPPDLPYMLEVWKPFITALEEKKAQREKSLKEKPPTVSGRGQGALEVSTQN